MKYLLSENVLDKGLIFFHSRIIKKIKWSIKCHKLYRFILLEVEQANLTLLQILQH